MNNIYPEVVNFGSVTDPIVPLMRKTSAGLLVVRLGVRRAGRAVNATPEVDGRNPAITVAIVEPQSTAAKYSIERMCRSCRYHIVYVPTFHLNTSRLRMCSSVITNNSQVYMAYFNTNKTVSIAEPNDYNYFSHYVIVQRH